MMIEHSIEWTEGGYRLVIWESAPKTAIRTSPFFFRATYWLSCPSKAPAILNMIKGESEINFSPANHSPLIDPNKTIPAPISTDHLHP